ncbi:MAG: tail fiber domain-containing protein [bacterium]
MLTSHRVVPPAWLLAVCVAAPASHLPAQVRTTPAIVATSGVSVAGGDRSWQSVSDVRKKTAFRELDGEKILEKLRAMPVRSWQYKSQSASIRHVGPTAQDFRKAFGLGESDTTITSVDADGVALAGVKALVVRTARLAEENAELRARLMRAENAVSANARLARELAALRVQVAALAGERSSVPAVRFIARTP